MVCLLPLWRDASRMGSLNQPRQRTALPHTFHIHAENEYFSREQGVVYRNGQVFRDIIDRTTGQVLDSQLIRTNHARVMYECPPDLVIQEKE